MRSRLRASLCLLGVLALTLPACGGGGGTSTPAPAPTSTSNAQNAFNCPSSDGSSSAVRGAGLAGENIVRKLPAKHGAASANTGLIAVTYDRSAFQRSQASFTRNESSAGGTLFKNYDYPSLNKTLRVLSVAPSQRTTAMAALRAQAGVLSVTPTGTLRYRMMVTHPYYPNDPYFNGFNASQISNGGATGSPTFQTPPYDEDAGVPGQWDMHAMKLEYAFAYSQAADYAAPNSAALGTHSVKIAVIDTGQDTLHPELQNNVVYQKCFITNQANTQSTSNFSTDPDGHGTDVSGIAAGVTNNNTGFSAAGGNTAIMAYRVFPTPDDSCGNPNSSDPQCGASTVDIADAIDDAVSNGANIISLSLGGSTCTSPGVDSDMTEGTAVANAISHNVVVVAAAGNESTGTSGKQPVDAPACDSGVIAVGASALSDGQPNGTYPGGGPGTAGTPKEYVAYYSNAGSSCSVRSTACWGLVAPGGDPSSDTDADDLHWIENIWTSTPYMANSNDSTFEGSCTDDFPNSTSTTPPVDCRTLIAGTSQATPHVAGVAALICGVNPGDCTPTKVFQILCQQADDINDTNQGCGRVDAYTAVATAIGDGSPPAPTP